MVPHPVLLAANLFSWQTQLDLIVFKSPSKSQGEFLDRYFLFKCGVTPSAGQLQPIWRSNIKNYMARLPWPQQTWTMLGVHFFETLFPCENKMSIKKFFHFCPLEIAASVPGWDGPSRLDWPCRLAAISEGQKWNCFLMLILSSHG